MYPKMLLLQAREIDDPAKFDEVKSYADRTSLPLSSFFSHDLLSGPPNIEKLEKFDAILIGGSGDFFVSKRNLPYIDDTLKFLKTVVDIGFPMFASCFGFQLLTNALGGKVIYDLQNMELGTKVVTLTDHGLKDDLLRILPKKFSAQLGHKDRAEILPPKVIHLGYSDKCPYQAFRVKEKPIWAVQFHPELTGEENKKRYERYLEAYAATLTPDEQEEVLNGFRPSPETEKLLLRFLELVGHAS